MIEQSGMDRARMTICDMFLDSVKQYSDRRAVETPSLTLTYRELGDLVLSAGRWFSNDRTTGHRRVALVGQNDPAYLAGYFGAQAVGRSTVEVGRNESLDRLVAIVRKTECSHVLTDREDLVEALKGETTAVSFGDFMEILSREGDGVLSDLPLATPPALLDEASIVFTSGTTSFPKGVVLTHNNFSFVTTVVADYLGIVSDDRYALILPLCHTYGKSIALTTIRSGATLVILNNFFDINQFIKALSDLKCTILSAVPYHAHVLLKRANLKGYDLSSLRALTFSGNKLPPSTIDMLMDRLPWVKIFSMYGLTESTTRSCYMPPEYLPLRKESCGRPLPGVELKVIDDDGNTLGPGQVGHVFIRGPNVMQCYYKEPELTEQTICDGWLNTGDLGRVDDEGFLFLEGREKEIIKCAGERISPIEIEETILRYPGVIEVAVTGSIDTVLGEIVHAYIVSCDGDFDERGLKSFCSRNLSHHKIPRKYSFVKELPKTATGKIKKHLLKEE